jgi:hypothetical protein
VWLVRVAENAGGLPCQGRVKQAVTEVGLRAATRAEIVRGAPDRDCHSAGLVSGKQLGGHLGSQLSLRGVCGVVAGLGQWLASRAAIYVDVLHADKPGPVGLRGGKDAGLERWKLLHQTRVRRVEGW